MKQILMLMLVLMLMLAGCVDTYKHRDGRKPRLPSFLTAEQISKIHADLINDSYKRGEITDIQRIEALEKIEKDLGEDVERREKRKR